VVLDWGGLIVDPERGGREDAGWTTGWKIAEVMFWGWDGACGWGARGCGLGGVVI